MVNDGEISLLGSRETPPSPQPAMFYSIVTLETCYASDVFRIFHHPNQLKQNPFWMTLWMTRFGSEPWGSMRQGPRGNDAGLKPEPLSHCRCHRGAPFDLCTRCSHLWTGAQTPRALPGMWDPNENHHIPSGKRLHNYGKSMNFTIFHGKTHYFDWAIFNSKLLNYQRVSPSTSAISSSDSYGHRIRWKRSEMSEMRVELSRCFSRTYGISAEIP